MRSFNLNFCYSFLIYLCVSLLLFSSNSYAKRRHSPVKKASIVVEGGTGRVLHASNPDITVHPASLTKIMTLYLLFEALESGKIKLNTRMKVSKKASRQNPCKLNLRPGQTIKVRDAIIGLMVKSANDASVAIAEHLAGSEAEFARRMTKKGRELGMRKTIFRNSSGLPNRHQVTSARDMVILSQAVFNHFPGYYDYFRTRTFTFKGRKYRNHNRLLGKVHGLDGIKTGFVNASGFNLAASAKRNGRRLFAVVMGGSSPRQRNKKMVHLLETSFRKGAHEHIVPSRKPLFAGRPRTYLAKSMGPQTKEELPSPPKKPRRSSGKSDIFLPAHKPDILLASKTQNLDERARLPRGQKTWSIQVGAFRLAKHAHRHAVATLKTLAPEFPTQIDISMIRRKQRNLYRSRLTGLTHEAAVRACRIVTQGGGACLPIRPHPSPQILSAMR